MINYFKSFKESNDGVAAIEFAIFALPFFLLLMGIIELGIMFGAATVMSGATEDAARLIRTGQAQDSGDAETAFKNEFCGNLYALMDCTNVKYHVIKLADTEDFQFALGNPTVLPPVVDTANPSQLTANTFDAGGPNDKIIVRVSYDYPLRTPLAAPLFANRPNNKHLLISTVVLQNEPYN